MKKLMMMSASVIALGALAQEVPVPPPVVAAEVAVTVPAVPALAVPVAAPAPVPVPTAPVAVSMAAALVEIEPGALCKTYLVEFGSRHGSLQLVPAIGTQALYDQMMDAIEHAVAADMAYDIEASQFDAGRVAKHKCNVAVWEGVLEAKKQGMYIFNVNSGFDYRVEVNDAFAYGVGMKTFTVDLNEGINRIKVVRLIASNSELEGRALPMGYREKKKFSLDYRLAASSKPSRSITPSMLKHIVEEEEVW